MISARLIAINLAASHHNEIKAVYRDLFGEILSIVLVNTHKISNIPNAKQFIINIYQEFAEFSSLDSMKSLMEVLIDLPQNEITIYSLLALASKLFQVIFLAILSFDFLFNCVFYFVFFP